MKAAGGLGEVVTLKDEAWLINQRLAGKTVAKCLRTCHDLIVNQEPNLTGSKLDKICLDIIQEKGYIPTFKGYHGFPGNVCVSINNQMVHGIPSDVQIQSGDIVSVDLGVTVDGAIADAAMTAIYGGPEAAKDPEHIRLLETCQKALNNAIEEVEVGKHVGCIGKTIHKLAHTSGFGLILNYGGHGLDINQPHSSPFVANKANSTDGVRLYPGMTLAIEPMLTIGSTKTTVENDGWTVTTPDMNAHFEHTIFISKNNVEILTQW